MNSRINLKDHPAIADLIRRADPTYRKHQAIIIVAVNAVITDTFWDGGSRASYAFVPLADGPTQPIPQYPPALFGGPTEVPRVVISPGTALVRTGITTGKVAMAWVYLNPANALAYRA